MASSPVLSAAKYSQVIWETTVSPEKTFEQETDNTPSILHPHGDALPMGQLFGDYTDAFDMRLQQPITYGDNHYSAHGPQDGEKVWFCSECGDGPYGMWQNCCQRCPHKKCNKCRVEEGS